MNITLRQLKVFESAAKHLNFTRAAEEVFLTQPAVSMQIKQLEEAVNMPLFERLGKKLYLTDAGREIFSLSKSISAQVRESAQVLEDLKGVGGGTLTVSVASTVHYFAIQLLADFCKLFPDASIKLQVTNKKGLLQQLASNETDIVLMGHPPEDQDLIFETFMDNPLVIIAPINHPLVSKKNIALVKLEHETFLMREYGSGTRSSIEQFLSNKSFTLTSSMEMNSNAAIKHAVEVGLGLGIVSSHTIEHELIDQRLAILDVENFPVMRHWYLVHRAGKRLSSLSLAFKKFVFEEADRLVKTENKKPDN